jgi:hypothetical protein
LQGSKRGLESFLQRLKHDFGGFIRVDAAAEWDGNRLETANFVRIYRWRGGTRRVFGSKREPKCRNRSAWELLAWGIPLTTRVGL